MARKEGREGVMRSLCGIGGNVRERRGKIARAEALETVVREMKARGIKRGRERERWRKDTGSGGKEEKQSGRLRETT